VQRWLLLATGLAGLACGSTATTYRGHYVFGHEVRAFTPCADAEDLWVVGDSQVVGPLELLHDSLTTEPYEAVFVEVHGHRLPGKGDGFAESYDGLIQFDSILSVSKQQPGDCGASKKPEPRAGN
jgi:hypothetical protein